MILSIPIRIAGALLLIGAVYMFIMHQRLILSVGQRMMLLCGSLIAGGMGISCVLMGDLAVAAIIVLGISPLMIIMVLQEYFTDTKLLKKLRMYEAQYRQAREEGNEDKMVDIHALAHACRSQLPGVKEAQDENDPTWRW